MEKVYNLKHLQLDMAFSEHESIGLCNSFSHLCGQEYGFQPRHCNRCTLSRARSLELEPTAEIV